jgi:hypothetical protein
VACQKCTVLNKQGLKRPPSKAKKTAPPRKKLPPGTVRERRIAPYKALTVAEYFEKITSGGRDKSWASVYMRAFARSWNPDIRGRPCQKCGYSKHTELAHIRPVRDFPHTATLGEIHASSNLLVLCGKCHWEFDHDQLKLTDIPARSAVGVSE